MCAKDAVNKPGSISTPNAPSSPDRKLKSVFYYTAAKIMTFMLLFFFLLFYTLTHHDRTRPRSLRQPCLTDREAAAARHRLSSSSGEASQQRGGEVRPHIAFFVEASHRLLRPSSSQRGGGRPRELLKTNLPQRDAVVALSVSVLAAP